MALKYQGHVFADHATICECCVGDAVAIADDPTGTKPVRKAMLRDATIKWQQVKQVTREMIITRDLLNLKAGGLLSLTAATNPALHGAADKVKTFQGWFDNVLDKLVLEASGMWVGPYVKQSYELGEAFARGIVNTDAASFLPSSWQRIEAIRALAVVEVQGIMEAVSQQAVRTIANGLLNGTKPEVMIREINDRIDKIGVVRTRAMIDMVTVKAFGDATLDVYESVGITEVGLIPEMRQLTRLTDAVKKRVKKRVTKKTKTGAGSRTSRKVTPSGSTIRRITEQEEKLERLGKVRVRTAEDEDVCPICIKIAKGGPYKIDKARSLIPAHPRCRCVFIPADDMRYRENKAAAKKKAARKKASIKKKPRTAKDAEALATLGIAPLSFAEGKKRVGKTPAHAKPPRRKVKKPPKRELKKPKRKTKKR